MKKNPQGSNLSRVKRRVGTIEWLNGMLSEICSNRFLLNILKKQTNSDGLTYQTTENTELLHCSCDVQQKSPAECQVYTAQGDTKGAKNADTTKSETQKQISNKEKHLKHPNLSGFWHGFLKTAKAFSLIELMISLIIVSCVTAAFAPVMTKKLQASAVTAGSIGDSLRNLKSGNECSSVEASPGAGNCKLCYINRSNPTKSKCIVCTNACTPGTYHNTNNCECVNCKAAYGDECYACNSTNCTICIAGLYWDNASYSCKKACDSPYSQKYYTDPDNNVTQPKYCDEGYICKDGIRTQCNSSSSSANNYTHAWCHDGEADTCTEGYICSNGLRTQCNSSSSSANNYTHAWCKDGIKNTCTEGYTCYNGKRTQCTTANGNSSKWCHDGIAETCPNGYYCVDGKKSGSTCQSNCKTCATSTKCAECSAKNYWVNSNGVCEYCNEGYYCDGKKRTACSTGTWTEEGSTSASSCTTTKCGTGFYCSNGNRTGCQDNCNTCANSTQCSKCQEGYYLTDSKTCSPCSNGYWCDGTSTQHVCSTGTWCEGSSCTSSSACTAANCGTGYTCENGKKTQQSDTYKVGNLTVMKRNLGDGDGYDWSTKPDTVKECIAGQSCSVSNSGSCASGMSTSLQGACWRSSGTYTAASGCGTSGYNACTRTVCNWMGAKLWCEHLGMRLPTKAELETIAVAGNNTSLNFCSYSSSDGVSLCKNVQSCKGAYNSWCEPNIVWSGELYPDSTKYAYNRNLNDGWNTNNNCLDNARSVRCVNGFIEI